MKQDCLFRLRLIVYRKPMRNLVAAALILCTTPAFAGATAWQEVAPDAKIRLISSDSINPEGSVFVGIEIDMPPASKTYWRVPGETGIPMMLDLSRSEGVSDYRIHWPYPQIDLSTGFLDFVYYGPVVLPVELVATGDSLTVDLDLILGVCSDICVPVKASFQLPISTDALDAGQSLRLDQALANVPVPPPDDTVVGEVSLSAEGLVVPLDSAAIEPGSVIAAASVDGLLFGAPQKSPDNGSVILPLLGGGEQQALLLGQQVEINFMTPDGPYVVARTIGPAESTPPVR
jgi:DsbC/DsbD-like thiol-disulfide interchange protein